MTVSGKRCIANVQLALFSMFKSVFESGTALWINGKLNEEGKWFKNNPYLGELYQNLTWSADRQSSAKSCLTVTKQNESVHVRAVNCYEKHWALCELREYSAPKPLLNEDPCVIRDEIFEEKMYETICLIGKKLTQSEAVSACSKQNISLLGNGTKAFNSLFYEKVKAQLPTNSFIWANDANPAANNKTCRGWKLSKYHNGSVDISCSEKLWT